MPLSNRYRRAHQLDQSIQIDDALVQRIIDRKAAAGKKKWGDGQVALSFGEFDGGDPAASEQAVRLDAGHAGSG